MDTLFKIPLERATSALPALVATPIKDRERDWNSRRYPEKTTFTIRLTDTTPVEKMHGYDLLMSWLGFEISVLSPGNKNSRVFRFQGDEHLLGKISGHEVEELIEVAEGKKDHAYLKCESHNFLVQRKDDERDPYTVVAGEEDAVHEKLKELFETKTIETYEIWSGAGSTRVATKLKMERDYEVTGIPEYGDTTIYPVAFCLGTDYGCNTILSLREAQRLILFGEVQTTWRNVTYGTGYRVIVTVRPKDTNVKEGLNWVINNPSD